ncbi:MAG: hypothetical protein LBE47_02770 [Methanomassiliicoccaceae archaeon]|jgi:hypothetical protein|nr:hypothetical protein [Methanomassiliicoccaceae archaeon]
MSDRPASASFLAVIFILAGIWTVLTVLFFVSNLYALSIPNTVTFFFFALMGGNALYSAFIMIFLILGVTAIVVGLRIFLRGSARFGLFVIVFAIIYHAIFIIIVTIGMNMMGEAIDELGVEIDMVVTHMTLVLESAILLVLAFVSLYILYKPNVRNYLS